MHGRAGFRGGAVVKVQWGRGMCEAAGRVEIRWGAEQRPQGELVIGGGGGGVGIVESLKNPDTVIPKGKHFPILEADLDFDNGNYFMNQATWVLWLLYYHDFRKLQTQINEYIVAF